MVQGRGGTGLAAKSFERLRILGYIVGQEFEGDETPEFGVFGLIYHAHPTTSKLVDNSVVRDGLADHGALWHLNAATKVRQ
jgi:hypothetical protein